MVEQAPYIPILRSGQSILIAKTIPTRRLAPYPFERSDEKRISTGSRPVVFVRLRRRTGSQRVRTQPAKQSKGPCLVPNPGGRSGSLGRSTAGHAVFIRCHTRTHRQRQGLDRRRSAGSICIGAAGFRATDCPRHAVEGSGAGTGARRFHRRPARELRQRRSPWRRRARTSRRHINPRCRAVRRPPQHWLPLCRSAADASGRCAGGRCTGGRSSAAADRRR